MKNLIRQINFEQTVIDENGKECVIIDTLYDVEKKEKCLAFYREWKCTPDKIDGYIRITGLE